MNDFQDMLKGLPDWHEKYNSDVGGLYSAVATAVSGALNVYTHAKEGKHHTLTGTGAVMRFLAAASWTPGDSMTVNGMAVEAKALDGQPLPADAFVTGAWAVAIKSGSTLQILTQSFGAINAFLEELKRYAPLDHRHQIGDTEALRETLDSLRRDSDVAHDALDARIEDVNGRIAAVSAALFEDITTNPFTIAFANLDGVVVESGVWNEARQRLEC